MPPRKTLVTLTASGWLRSGFCLLGFYESEREGLSCVGLVQSAIGRFHATMPPIVLNQATVGRAVL